MDENEKSIIERIIKSLGGYALGDIRKSIKLVNENNMHIGSFILCSCFIDQVSAFYYGTIALKTGKNGEPIFNVRKRFIKFCDDYLKKIDQRYNSEHLYNDFRCKIVHNYSSGKNSFALGRIGSGAHLSELRSNEILLIIEDFYNHIVIAFEEWHNDLYSKKEVRKNAVDWFNLFGIYEQSQ
jgi:hypothetical protein